jgi:hypothetical protein
LKRQTFEGFTKRYVLLCEGDNDQAFFEALLVHHALQEFQVICPKTLGYSEGGKGYFKKALSSFWARTGFDKVEAVLIASDNDDDCPASLVDVRNAITDAEADTFSTPPKNFSAPDQPLQKVGTSPFVVVMMLPWVGELGNLETLCFEAASRARPNIRQCVDVFGACTGVATWRMSRRSKMQMRSMISGAHEENPDMGLTFLWKYRPDLVPINDHVFDRIADFLRNFHTFLQQP